MTGAALCALAFGPPATPPARADDEPLTVSTDHPRLFLRPARLRLLKRERERGSMRWQQFEALVAGNAPLPEPGFALALYYQVSGNAGAGRRAVEWAMGPRTDLRQLAVVFDWCQELLDDAQRQKLAALMEQRIAASSNDDSVAAVRSRVLAAAALFDHVPDAPRRELGRAREWWNRKIVPALAAGRNPLARADDFALFELLHAMRDNTNLDLREACPEFFKNLPAERLLSYYPASYPAPENDFYIGASPEVAPPNLRAAALSRAADLEMVAYDTNDAGSQVLQGWLMHDRFMLRGTFGAPYEFLWANPYQPGLSYYHVPLVDHDARLGTLFVRSSWDDSARWFGWFDGAAQVFEDGRPAAVDPRKPHSPLAVGPAVICFGQAARRFRVSTAARGPLFIVGVEPRRTYQVEVDDEEMYEASADPGGILEIEIRPGKQIGVRIREAGGAQGTPSAASNQ